ncbi:helix-turn-helix transcriptional regulator [Conexibacter sp. SYSU D00693]|uniref:helix-turn-helix transcriptional regulator n=1 Tax=Conexibacter sp. SYSU D00693 TaxID=2812560 RepID=UPI00196AA17A|nr:helix-turn-helix transcriptional regulator [Conexibacter sp. SYSU D00693]
MPVAIASSRFVGRGLELERLEAALADAAAGRPQTVLVGGEAGVGKTRLTRELLERARATGAIALLGGCVDVADGGLPLWPFVEALRAYAADLDDEARAELLAGAGPEVARILPELASDEAGPAPAAGASAQGRLFELLLALLGRLAHRAPLVLVVEDLHWADRSTRDLLSFVVRSVRTERLLLVATFRADELHRGHPLRPLLAELHRARVAQRLDLGPFSRAEVGEQLAGLTGAPPDPALVEAVFSRSEGNAFFAEELLAAGEEGEGELPSTLRDILLARVEHRSPGAQELLRHAAVAGRRVPVALLDAVCPLPAADRREALREVVAHHLLVADGDDGYAFRHALLREAVYDELLPGERRELHVGCGAALSERPELAGDPAVAVGELAYHWWAAHDAARALEAAVVAGRAAQARWGFAEAQAHLERALDLWDGVPDAAQRTGTDRESLAREAAEAANLAGDHARAAALMRSAISRADPRATGLLHERLGRYLWAAGDSEAARSAYDRALELVPADPPSPARARVLAAHGQSLMLLARFEDAVACCQDAIRVARAVGARAEEGHALNSMGCAQGFLGDPAAGVEHLRAALAIADEVGDLDDLGRAYQNLSELLGGPLNQLDEALEVALEGQRRIEPLGLARDYGVSLEVNAATALLALGRWAEADALLATAEDRSPVEMAAIELRLCRARLEVGRGDVLSAAEHVEAARRLMASVVDPQFWSVHAATRAELALWQGDVAGAAAAVQDGLRRLEDADDAWFGAPLLWLGAWTAADASQRREDAAGLEVGALVGRADELVAAARRPGGLFVSPVTVAFAQSCRAEAARLAGTGEVEAWAAAVEAWEAAGHPFRLGCARWRHAEALLAARRGQEGRSALLAARDVARATGATALAREVEGLARRARVDLAERDAAPAATSDDRHGLTPRELQVLQLVGAGHTNREIAEALFVTEKTAGAHVSNILSKLGVRGRVEAATLAHRLGLLPDP